MSGLEKYDTGERSCPEKYDIGEGPCPKRYYTGEKRCPEQYGSRRLTIIMRAYRPGDEEGMRACIREEYKDTYYKKDLYQPEFFLKASGSGKYTFLAAQTKAGEIAGMLILESAGGKTALCCIESLFIRKKYRGYGLAGPFLRYGMEIAQKRKYAAACCCPVLFHDITQRLLYRMGFRATGFLLNVFGEAEMVHSLKKGKNRKKSLGLQLLPIGKRNAGTLYVPPEHRKFIAKIYKNLSMEFRIVPGSMRMPENVPGGMRMPEDMPDGIRISENVSASMRISENMPGVSQMSCHEEPHQKSLEIRIWHCGMDLPGRMAKIHAGYPQEGMWTVNVFLNMKERCSAWAYGKLRELHYFFTGVCSLGNAGEYMILHYAGGVECFLEEFAAGPEFSEILQYVRKQYERRNAHEKKETQSPP